MTTQEPHVTVTRTTQPILTHEEEHSFPGPAGATTYVTPVHTPGKAKNVHQPQPTKSTHNVKPEKFEKHVERQESQEKKYNLKMPKMSPMELIRWLSLLGLGVATMSAGIWGVPRLWNWTRSTVPTLWGGGKSYKPEYKQHYNVHENDRYSRSPAGAPHWQSASPFSEALGSLDNFANSFLWPYNTPSTRPGATIPGEGPAYFPPSLYSGGLPPGGPPPGLRDYGNHYSMSLAMPGLAENDVMVRFSEAGARLRVDAHARTMDRKTGRRGELLEVAVVTVPRDAEVDRAVAEMTNGMLTLTIPKRNVQSADVHVPVKASMRDSVHRDFFSGRQNQQPQQGQESTYQRTMSAFEKTLQDIYNGLPQSLRDQPNIMSTIRTNLQRAYDTGSQLPNRAADTAADSWNRVKQAGQQATDVAYQYGSQATNEAKGYGSQATNAAYQYGQAATDQAKGYGAAVTDAAYQYGAAATGVAKAATDVAYQYGAAATDAAYQYGAAATDAAYQYGSAATDVAKQYGAAATDVAYQYGSAATQRAREAGGAAAQAGAQATGYFGHVGAQATEGLKHAGEYVADAGTAATEGLKQAGAYVTDAGSAATDRLKGAGEFVVEQLQHMGGFAADVGSTATMKVKEAGESVVEGAMYVGERIAGAGAAVTDTVGGVVRGAGERIVGAGAAVTNTVGQAVRGAGERASMATEAVKGVPDQMRCGFEEVKEGVRERVCRNVGPGSRASVTHVHTHVHPV